jgi:hypothetical protein
VYSLGPRYISFSETLNYLTVNDDKKAAWNAFCHVATVVVGSVKVVNVRKLVEDLVTSYKNLSCNVLLKIHFCHSHLDSFLVHCGAVSDEHIKHFHQDISAMENTYNDKWRAATLADDCWMVKRDSPEIQY